MRHFHRWIFVLAVVFAQSAQANIVTVSTTLSGIIYDSDLSRVLGNVPFTDGAPYELAVSAVFDTSHIKEPYSGDVNIDLARVKAVLSLNGQTYQTEAANGNAAIFFQSRSGFTNDHTFVSWVIGLDNDSLPGAQIYFVHAFEVPSVFFPSENALDPADVDVIYPTRRDVIISLYDPGSRSVVNRLNAVPTGLHWQVSVASAVPEPAVWMLLLAGLAIFTQRRLGRDSSVWRLPAGPVADS